MIPCTYRATHVKALVYAYMANVNSQSAIAHAMMDFMYHAELNGNFSLDVFVSIKQIKTRVLEASCKLM